MYASIQVLSMQSAEVITREWKLVKSEKRYDFRLEKKCDQKETTRPKKLQEVESILQVLYPVGTAEQVYEQRLVRENNRLNMENKSLSG